MWSELEFIDLEQTCQPVVANLGFILTGIGRVLAAPTLVYLCNNKTWRALGAIALLTAALIWAIIGDRAYWGHLESLSEGQPPVMQLEP